MITFNAKFTRIAKKFKEKYPHKNIWLYTGFLWEQISNLEIVQYLDVVIDGKFMEELKDNQLEWKGSSNQRTIDVKATLEKGEVVLYMD